MHPLHVQTIYTSKSLRSFHYCLSKQQHQRFCHHSTNPSHVGQLAFPLNGSSKNPWWWFSGETFISFLVIRSFATKKDFLFCVTREPERESRKAFMWRAQTLQFAKLTDQKKFTDVAVSRGGRELGRYLISFGRIFFSTVCINMKFPWI